MSEESSKQELVKTSKFLSLVLRHQPDIIGLILDDAGWVSTSDLIAACNDHGHTLNSNLLKKVVVENEKRRFEFSDDGNNIRASQGHSIPVELGYEPKTPPKILYHGTVDKHLSLIRQDGLIKGQRQHVHLSSDEPTAIKVGSRRGKPVVLEVRALDLHESGHAFFLSTNGVWLTEAVPPAFLTIPETTTKTTSGRSHRARLAETTLQCIDAGGYRAPSGRWVDIQTQVTTAVAGSRAVPPEEHLSPSQVRIHTTLVEIMNATSIEALVTLHREGAPRLACLNFASAKNPGGGFLKGSKAQEESLACSSALYPCLLAGRAYYNANRANTSALYTDWIIWSPGVPFIRRDDGSFLESPVLADVITAPAPNAGAVAHANAGDLDKVYPALHRRAIRVCQAAAAYSVKTFVLGAWGCGVFRNEPKMVAEVFAQLLATNGPFEGVFERVVFAIHDTIKGSPVIEAFRTAMPTQK